MVRRFQEDLVHPAPAEILEQPPNTPLHAFNIDVVAETRFAANACDTRLPGINLPGVEVKNAGLAIFLCSRAGEYVVGQTIASDGGVVAAS